MSTVESDVALERTGADRAALLRAARVLATRDGLKNLTLSRVAIEAGLPRKLVVRHFASKRDLLLFAAAESVSTLARVMALSGGPSDHTHEEYRRDGAVILTLPRRDANRDRADPAVSLAREVSLDLTKLSAASKKALHKKSPLKPHASRNKRKRRVRARVKSADGPCEIRSTFSPSPEERSRDLEVQLGKNQRTLERAIRLIKEVREQSEKDDLAANAAEAVCTLQSRFDDMAARLDQCETRQASVTSDLRRSLDETGLRIETVEAVARAALLENQSRPLEKALISEPPPSLEAQPVSAQEATIVATERHAKDYLNSARATANAAALANAETSRSANLERMIRGEGLAAAIFLVVSVAVGLLLGQRLWHLPSAPDAVAPAPPALVAAAADTPLDRLTEGALAGDAGAELAVALKDLNGVQGPADPTAALNWLGRSATHGNAVAQYLLGSFYETGRATTRDLLKAMRWYEAAALQGNRKAMHSLAIGYAKGFGGLKSPTEAVRWFSRAASLGYKDSEFNLAVLYERGLGVPQSLLDAYKWYVIAARQGDGEAKARADALQTQLPPNELVAAKRAADAFIELPFDPATNSPPNF